MDPTTYDGGQERNWSMYPMTHGGGQEQDWSMPSHQLALLRSGLASDGRRKQSREMALKKPENAAEKTKDM